MASSGAAWPILSAAAREEEEAAAERRVGQSVGRRHAKLSTQSRLKQQLARSSAALPQCVQPTTRERSRKKERREGGEVGKKERPNRGRSSPQSAQIGSDGGGGGGETGGGGGYRQDVKTITNEYNERARVTEAQGGGEQLQFSEVRTNGGVGVSERGGGVLRLISLILQVFQCPLGRTRTPRRRL